MKLYHLHAKGNHDELWHEGSEIVVDDRFQNGVFDNAADFSTFDLVEKYNKLIDIYNAWLLSNDYPDLKGNNRINIEQLLMFHNFTNKEEQLKLRMAAYDIIRKANEFKREMALENYRKDFISERPSRFHSVFLTDEKNIDYWAPRINGDEIEVFSVDAEEPFLTNEQLLPAETLNYGEAYILANRYWNPMIKPSIADSNEYLANGIVRVRTKVGEIKRNKVR